ncbi:MAG TPA: hypothetical protein VK773_07810 [Acidimicrobiales bacterium]|nr:hypothetical protein [Acidimicrobiales bacterium]
MSQARHSLLDEDRTGRVTLPGSGSGGLDRRPALLIAAVVAAVALVVAVRDVRVVLYDDAAITLRYAWRIAHGGGFTYNPGDRTDGASAPLYTLVLALISYLGGGLIGAAKVICIASFTVTTALVSYLAGRMAGVVAGIVAPILLLGSLDFRLNALSGMESALAAALSIAALVALYEERIPLCGLLLGLDLFNKLDAGTLVVAVCVAYLLFTRRIPWRLLAWCAAGIVPWLIFAQVYFGSVVPNSARVKASVLSKGTTLNHAWMLDSIRADHGLWILAFAVASLPIALYRRNRTEMIVTVSLLGYFALELLAFSSINLGAPYPWYMTVLYPPIACAAGLSVGWLVDISRRHVKRSVPASYVGVALAGVVGLALVYTTSSGLRSTAHVVVHGHTVDGYEAFEGTRRDSGYYLNRVTRPGQVVETCFGWPAFLDEKAVIKETCPLSTRRPVGPPTWGTDADFPALSQPFAPPGAKVVWSQTSKLGGDSWVWRVDRTSP